MKRLLAGLVSVEVPSMAREKGEGVSANPANPCSYMDPSVTFKLP